MHFQIRVTLAAAALLALNSAGNAQSQMPAAIAAPGETAIATIHAQGAQLYECKADSAGKLTWQFREPIASLLLGGKTVGRHYAGPNWEHADGSAVVAKVAGRAPGATPKDILWLKLEVTERRGNGILTPATTIQRINTSGGTMEGACDKAGAFHAAAYSTDYVFLKK
jgi:hypothetical protein